MKYRVTVFLAYLLAVLSPTAIAEDWPHWTGPYGTNSTREQGLAREYHRGTRRNIKWQSRLGGVVFGCPTISSGRIFVGSNMGAVRADSRFRDLSGGVLACLDETTGERIWSLVSPERTSGFPPKTFVDEQRWGICSSPTVDGDRVYIITNGDDVLCLDVKGLVDGNDGAFQEEAQFMAGQGKAPIDLQHADADILWRYDIPAQLQVAPHDVGSCSVLIHGDMLYTSTSNGIGMYDKPDEPSDAVNPDAPAFIVLNKYTGALLAVDDTAISQNLFHAQWSCPSQGRVEQRDLILLGGADGFCYAFEALDTNEGIVTSVRKLKTVWKCNCNPTHYRQMPDGTPIEYAWGDHRDYVRKEELNHDIEKLNETKKAVGKSPIEYKASLEKYNAGDGAYIGPSEIIATPVFYEKRVYIATGRDPLHGLGRGVLTCIDATGQGDISESGIIWRFEGIGRTLSSVAVADGLVYATDLQGCLYCLDANNGQLYWQHDTGSEIWGNPVVADGKVYLNAKDSFWILSAGKKKEELFNSRGGSECAPVIANGTVYTFASGSLYAIAALDHPALR